MCEEPFGKVARTTEKLQKELKVNTKGTVVQFDKTSDFKFSMMTLYPKLESGETVWFIIKARSTDKTGVLNCPGDGKECDLTMEKYKEGDPHQLWRFIARPHLGLGIVEI